VSLWLVIYLVGALIALGIVLWLNRDWRPDFAAALFSIGWPLTLVALLVFGLVELWRRFVLGGAS
jgi:hypothetical protein